MKKQAQHSADAVDSQVFDLPIIHCKCGAKILLIRNAASTGKAIEWHTQNCRLTKQSKNPAKCMEKLNRHLIKQVMNLAAAEEQPEEKHPINTTHA